MGECTHYHSTMTYLVRNFRSILSYHSFSTGGGISRTFNASKANIADSGAESSVDNVTNRDRLKSVSPETSIRYMKSAAYKEAYGSSPVWEQYRRNHKGMYPPRRTRKTCIRKGVISTGNPCPICRDEYLVLDHKNTDLLKQFVSFETGEVLSYSKTGVCQRKHQELLVAVERARDYGFLTFDVPFREFNYNEYYNKKN